VIQSNRWVSEETTWSKGKSVYNLQSSTWNKTVRDCLHTCPLIYFLYMTSGPVTITRTFYYSSGMFNLWGNKATVLSICLQIWWSLSFNPVIHHNLVLMALGMAFTRRCCTAIKATKRRLDIIVFSVLTFLRELANTLYWSKVFIFLCLWKKYLMLTKAPFIKWNIRLK